MRIAALALGIVAGLIASLILALGGLEVISAATAPDRSVQVWRFVLYVIANFGVLGAGLVLASPLVGAILFAVGAVAWVVAALLLRHGPDLVLITPPVLLLAATAFAVFAFIRKNDRMPTAVAPMRMPVSSTSESEDFGEMPATKVKAGFFGDGGTAAPMRTGSDREPSMGGGEAPPPAARSGSVDWTPGRRRPAPPRQRPVFRPVDDEYEESGWSRVARGVSSILSFGLYAGIAAGVVLVFWNLRPSETGQPAAAKLEPAAVASTQAPVKVAETKAPAVKPQPKAAASAAAASASSERLATQSGLAFDAGQPIAEAQPSLQRPNLAGVVVQDGTMTAPDQQTATLSTQAASAEQPAPDALEQPASGPSAAAAGVVMPFPVTSQMAALREGGSAPAAPAATVAPKRTTPAAPKPDLGM
ncbi:MAG: hypothetical protein ABI697_06610 [Devosia sp.]